MTGETATDLLSAEGVAKSYRLGGRDLPVLRSITLRIRPRESVAIIGASGAGKTTLLNVLGGLDGPSGGTVRFDGRDLYGLPSRERSRLRATRLGFVFQAYHLVPELTLLENVRLASMTGRSSIRGHEAAARALDLVRKVGLQDRAHHRPDELSGGEQQRVAIARALMNDPDLVLADEPTGNLDSGNGRQVLHHLFEMVRERRHALVLVTHNEEIAARCDRILELQDGILGQSAV